MIYLELFFSFFQIGLLSIGGGYAAMPLIQQQIVEIHGWLTMSSFADIVTIAEMTPGPIAINAATFVGAQVAGVGGSLVATLGCVLGPAIIVSLLAYIYNKYRELDSFRRALKGLRPAVVALIASAALSLFLLAVYGEARINYIGAGLFLAALFALRKYKLNPILVILISGAIGLCVYPFI